MQKGMTKAICVTKTASFMTVCYFVRKSLITAAELGDYEEGTHTPALISEFRFVPNQNEEFEIDVLEAYKRLR